MGHPDVFGHPTRGDVVGMDDGHETFDPGYVSRKIKASLSSFLGVASPLEIRSHVVADFQLAAPIHCLPGQPAVAHKTAVVRFQNPQPVPVAGVVCLVPSDPSRSFLP